MEHSTGRTLSLAKVKVIATMDGYTKGGSKTYSEVGSSLRYSRDNSNHGLNGNHGLNRHGNLNNHRKLVMALLNLRG